MKAISQPSLPRKGYVMLVTWIARLMPRAAARPGHRPRRLSLEAALVATAMLIACLAAGSASAMAGRPAVAGTGGGFDTAAPQPGGVKPGAVQVGTVEPGAGPPPGVSCGPPDYYIECYSPSEYQVA